MGESERSNKGEDRRTQALYWTCISERSIGRRHHDHINQRISNRPSAYDRRSSR